MSDEVHGRLLQTAVRDALGVLTESRRTTALARPHLSGELAGLARDVHGALEDAIAALNVLGDRVRCALPPADETPTVDQRQRRSSSSATIPAQGLGAATRGIFEEAKERNRR